MDHAAAHEQIEDLLVEPARMAALEASTSARDVALREHVAGCTVCRADLEAWQRLQAHLSTALPGNADAAAAAVEPIELPPSLRARVLGSIRQPDQARSPINIARARSRRRVSIWVGLAASIVVLTGTGIITIDQVVRRAAAEAEAKALSGALAAVDRILEVPNHKVVALTTASGSPAGSISWSRHDWVVLTAALVEPPSDQRYLCWLESDGRSVPVGKMDFAGDTAYWVASVDEWATWSIGPNTRFVVTLEPKDATERTGLAVLSADLRTT
jgi:hypothetical protein